MVLRASVLTLALLFSTAVSAQGSTESKTNWLYFFLQIAHMLSRVVTLLNPLEMADVAQDGSDKSSLTGTY